MAGSYVSLIVPKQSVKAIKTALEARGKLDKGRKICPYANFDSNEVEEPVLVPTTIDMMVGYTGPGLANGLAKEELKKQFLADLGLGDLSESISIYEAPRRISTGADVETETNPFIKAVRAYLSSLPPDFLAVIGCTIHLLIKKLPTTYSIYPPMLLLPAHVFKSPEWQRFLSKLSTQQQEELYQALATAMSVTHIAINASIPLLSKDAQHTNLENILRSPTNLTPLHGNFGPVCTSPTPTPKDFTTAFWASTKQNGITQIWAPRYTMFSRGNITEKTRLLTLPSITASAKQEEGSTAIDLYAGIGYFSFSYAKAHIKTIIGFELNPWSIEGFRRGALKNNWDIEIYSPADIKNLNPTIPTSKNLKKKKFLLFQTNNENAPSILQSLSGVVPPIRHVNCGLLPSSRGSWDTALGILNPEVGGWIHVHENIAIQEISTKSEEITDELQKLLDAMHPEGRGRGRKSIALLEHVEKVKTFAPGVMHCVLDIHVTSIICKR